MKFSGNIALVAGAGGGIGLDIANNLIEHGMNVGLADVKPKPVDISDGPGKHQYFQLDVSQETQVSEMAASVASQFGGIDYLVNTVGVLWFDKDKSITEMDMDVWDQVMNINLKSFALTSRYVIPHMQRAGGAMVHFSSIDALSGDDKPQDAYGASKAAVIRLSKSIAIQFAKDKIRSNVILPGPVMSPMQNRWKDKPDVQAKVAKQIPLGRLGKTHDLANACLFLLSDDASWITGTELVVDGGLTAKP